MGMDEDCTVSVGCALLGGHPGACAASAVLQPDVPMAPLAGEYILPPQVSAPHTVDPASHVGDRDIRPMRDGDAFDPKRLDPGIRRLVMHLRTLGVPTTDSGDGVSKPAEERALDQPHVFAVYRRDDWRTALLDADRVGAMLPRRDGSEVVLSYNVHDRQLVLAVVGYSDRDLP